MLKAGSLLLTCGLFFVASGQVRPDLAVRLQSTDWRERAAAYRYLADEKNRTADENSALVALLLSEKTPALRPATGPSAPDDSSENDHDPNPDFVQYMDSLVHTVMEVADREPKRSDVWPALLAVASFDGNSVMMPWFARHSDQVAPYFLAAAKNSFSGQRGGALIGLAKIASYERDPMTIHHLGQSDVQLLDRTIRDNLDSADVVVRMQAIAAVGIMGNADDLNLLDRIAASDTYYDAANDLYPYRVSARVAAKNIRKRLASQRSPKQ
jgi:hypothetical protein